MINVYEIRLEAISSNYSKDGDNLRRGRELSRLEIDVCAALRRCTDAGDKNCSQLENLADHLDDIQRGTLAC